ncbi:MAG: DUF2330 domain-containing protein [Myxococcales bacterium]
MTMDGQREFMSVHAASTDIVAQVFVPAGGDFGILMPAPAQPTIDPTPVPSSDLDALDMATRPRITVETPSSEGEGGGCGIGCGAAGKSAGGLPPIDTGVRTGPPVTVGPVVATPLTATDSSALDAWLAQNGFALSAADQTIVDGYVGAGQWFVALKPSAEAGDGGAVDGGVSVGLHYSVPVVDDGLELKMASVGASGSMSFTVFVAAAQGVGPTNAAALTLLDLDAGLLAQSYPEAVAAAVGSHGGQAWVVEGNFDPSVVGGALAAMLDPSQGTLTRLSTVVTPAQMTYDPTFAPPGPSGVVNSRTVASPSASAWFPGARGFGGGPDDGDAPGGGGRPPRGAGPGLGLLGLFFFSALFLRRRLLRAA